MSSVQSRVGKVDAPKSKLAMACAWIHKLYDDIPKPFDHKDLKNADVCWIEERIDFPPYGPCWRGSWVFGMGVFDVKFPLWAVRPATAAEMAELMKGRVVRGSWAPSFRIAREWFATAEEINGPAVRS